MNPCERREQQAEPCSLKAAAANWKVPETECQASLGTVKHTKSNRSLTYGKLCQDAAKLEVPKEPALKKESEFRYIGKTMPRVDVPEKVSGKAVYGADVRLKDLHYAVIARPPAYGAKLISFDGKAAEQIKGVVKVIQFSSPWASRSALNQPMPPLKEGMHSN